MDKKHFAEEEIENKGRTLRRALTVGVLVFFLSVVLFVAIVIIVAKLAAREVTR